MAARFCFWGTLPFLGSPRADSYTNGLRKFTSFAALLCSLCALAQAHDLYRSESRLEIRGREVTATFTLNLLDFQGVDKNKDKRVTQEEFAPEAERIYASLDEHYILDSSGPPVRRTRTKVELFDEHVLTVVEQFTFPQDVLALQVTSTLPEILGSTHIHLVSVYLGGRLQENVLEIGRAHV